MKDNSFPTKDIKKIEITKENNKNKVTDELKDKKTEVIAKGEDFTQYVLARIPKSHIETIKKVYKNGRNYTIIFNDGFTAFQQTSRKCKDVFGVMWYAKIATEEKQKGFSFDYWKNWLDKEKIVWDGQHIPEYLWTKEQYKKYNVKEDKFVKQGV